MDNHRRKIVEYRELSEVEIAQVNELKAQGAIIGQKLDRIARKPGVDQRALAIARTELQSGFMWAIRAITKPEGFA